MRTPVTTSSLFRVNTHCNGYRVGVPLELCRKKNTAVKPYSKICRNKNWIGQADNKNPRSTGVDAWILWELTTWLGQNGNRLVKDSQFTAENVHHTHVIFVKCLLLMAYLLGKTLYMFGLWTASWRLMQDHMLPIQGMQCGLWWFLPQYNDLMKDNDVR